MKNEEAVKGVMKIWNGYIAAYAEVSHEDVEAYSMAIEALSKQSASSKQADQCGNDTEMVELKKRTITERLIIAESLIYGVIADSDQFREDTKKTGSERVSLSEQEKSNSFSEKPSEEGNSEMNCSDVPDIHVGKTDFKPGGNPGIIHCKDCKKFVKDHFNIPYCYRDPGCKWNENDYCSKAERRNDERMGNS